MKVEIEVPEKKQVAKPPLAQLLRVHIKSVFIGNDLPSGMIIIVNNTKLSYWQAARGLA